MRHVSLYCRCLLAWFGLFVPGALCAEPLVIEHAVITRQVQADNGTAHLYVRNSGERPVEVTSINVASNEAGIPAELLATTGPALDEAESHLPYLWWRCLPNPIPPGGFADLAVKLARPANSKLSVSFSGPNGIEVRHTFDRVNDPLAITSVGFSPNLQEVFIYFENRTEQRIEVGALYINGEDVSKQGRFLHHAVIPFGKSAAIVLLDSPLVPGQFLFLRLGRGDGITTTALTRAFSMFPITWLDGSLPAGLEGAGEADLIRPGSVSKEGLAGIENIMRCPAHAHGARTEAATKYLAAHDRLIRAEPQVPGLIYVCRWAKEQNYFVFAELGDFVRVMPFAGSPGYVQDPLNHRMQWVTSLAVRAAAPRPVHAVVPIRFEDSFQWERSITPDEVRALVYLPISRGAKGLCYGRREPGLTAQAEQELARVTREIVSLREYLVYAEPFPLGHANKPRIEAATLLAGDRAMIVLLINHGFEDFDNPRVLSCPAEPSVQARIELPPGLQVDSIRDVQDARRTIVWRQAGHEVIIDAEQISVVRPYLAMFRCPPAPGSVTSSSQGGQR